MTTSRVRLLGAAAAALVLIAAWFALVSPQRSRAAELDESTAGEQIAAAQLEARISLLKKMSEELPAQEAKLASIQQRMPSTVALPTLIRNLTDVAQEANVVVSSVTPGRPTPIDVPITSTRPPAPAQDDASPEGGTEAEPTAPQSATVEAVSLNITACGTFAQLRNYLGNLESMRRVMAVSTLSIAHGSCDASAPEDGLTANITANVFTLPGDSPDATSSNGGTDDE